MDFIITVYVVSNPLDIPTRVFSDENNAKAFLVKEFAERGERYTYEPCVMQVDELFIKRLKVLEEQLGIQYFK